MKNLISTLGAIFLTGFASLTVNAHHSAIQFDFVNTVVVEGKVMKARFSNPHMMLILEVTDESGTREIEFEGHSRNNMLRRQGLMPNMFTTGDIITIRIAPMKNGKDGGYVTAVRTPDGTEIGNITAAD